MSAFISGEPLMSAFISGEPLMSAFISGEPEACLEQELQELPLLVRLPLVGGHQLACVQGLHARGALGRALGRALGLAALRRGRTARRPMRRSRRVWARRIGRGRHGGQRLRLRCGRMARRIGRRRIPQHAARRASARCASGRCANGRASAFEARTYAGSAVSGTHAGSAAHARLRDGLRARRDCDLPRDGICARRDGICARRDCDLPAARGESERRSQVVDEAALEAAVCKDHAATIEGERALQQAGQPRILPLCERRPRSLAAGPLAAAPRRPCAQGGARRQPSDDLP